MLVVFVLMLFHPDLDNMVSKKQLQDKQKQLNEDRRNNRNRNHR